jgi:hypothetical protein
MHHRRVVQEKNMLVRDMKRLKKVRWLLAGRYSPACAVPPASSR